MTVKEFIEQLKKLDQNKKIMVMKTYQDEMDELQLYTENEEISIDNDYDWDGKSIYVIN